MICQRHCQQIIVTDGLARSHLPVIIPASFFTNTVTGIPVTKDYSLHPQFHYSRFSREALVVSVDTCSYVMIAFGEWNTGLWVWVCPISLFYSWSQLLNVASRVAVCTPVLEPVFRLKNSDEALILKI